MTIAASLIPSITNNTRMHKTNYLIIAYLITIALVTFRLGCSTPQEFSDVIPSQPQFDNLMFFMDEEQIAMGGYDFHTGNRSTGEVRDLRAGRCMGACLEYAARMGRPLMLHIFSDGSVASNGRIDDTPNGRGKGEWTGDNASTGASFFLVYNPGGRPSLIGSTPEQQAIHQQIGYMRPDASVETASTPAANNVNLLVETIILNYMALHGEQGNFATLFPNHGLGNATLRDSLTAFQAIV